MHNSEFNSRMLSFGLGAWLFLKYKMVVLVPHLGLEAQVLVNIFGIIRAVIRSFVGCRCCFNIQLSKFKLLLVKFRLIIATLIFTRIP